jgi:alginate O-acetyltransferase complex protein AlgJ
MIQDSTVPYLHREIQAKRDLGTTDVSPALAALFAGLFLGMIVAVPLLQREPLPRFERDGSLVASIHRFEARLEERSWLVGDLLPPVQLFLTGGLGLGNPQVYVGRDGWLFYRPAVDFLTGPGFLDPAVLEARRLGGDAWTEPVEPDPRPALVELHRQLAARGIRLLVMPTPVKAAIHPERLTPRAARPPLRNPSEADLFRSLEAEGIAVLDVAPLVPQYLATDSHWTPAGLERVARALADRVRGELPAIPDPGYRSEERPVTGTGDLVRLLKLPPGQTLYPPQEVRTAPVLEPDGAPWRPDPGADVLLLGDSFTNVFSRDDLGWGTGAGLAERLSFHLRRPVDRIAVNAGGAHASREALARDLAAGRDRLAGKRLVIVQFAARELAAGDWRR